MIPVYGNAGSLPALVGRLHAALDAAGRSHRIIFVDDLSPDHSRAVLRRLAATDPLLELVFPAARQGQHRAVVEGLRRARGNAVVVMDADLQDPPEAVPLLLSRLDGGGAAVVFAGRRGRYGSRGRLLTSRLFKYLLHLACGVPADAGMFLAMREEVVERLLAIDEPRPHLVGMIGCTGFRGESIPVERAPRPSGSSGYTSWARLRVGANALLRVPLWRYRLRRNHA